MDFQCHRLRIHARPFPRRVGTCFALIWNALPAARPISRPALGADWARLAGLWRDIGKYQPDFQRYLRATPEAASESLPGTRVPHSIAGAALAISKGKKLGLPLAHTIAAHHGKLHGRTELTGSIEENGMERLRISQAAAEDRDLFERALPTSVPAALNDPAATTLWIRMLFSALLDADMHDTEAWDKGEERPRCMVGESSNVSFHHSPLLIRLPHLALDHRRAAFDALNSAVEISQ